MFKRRYPRSLAGHTREFFWPSIGWKRSFIYIKHRIVRLSDSTHSIAAGLALGASVSFTPLIGTHFLQAMAVAWLLKFNLLASIIGTFIGNPWTFPFLWWFAYEVGAQIFGLFGVADKATLPENLDFPGLIDMIWTHPLKLFLPWLVGGYVCALVFFPAFYLIFFNMVKTAKAARKKAKLYKLHRVAKEVTGQKH